MDMKKFMKIIGFIIVFILSYNSIKAQPSLKNLNITESITLGGKTISEIIGSGDSVLTKTTVDSVTTVLSGRITVLSGQKDALEDSINNIKTIISVLDAMVSANTQAKLIHEVRLDSLEAKDSIYGQNIIIMRAAIDSINTLIPSGTNHAPTNISASQDSIILDTPTNTNILYFTTTDQDSGDDHDYSLVIGPNDDHNGYFTISNTGWLIATQSLDNFNIGDTIKIRVRTDDGLATYTEAFQFVIKASVDNNFAPTDILLSSNSVSEGRLVGYIIGTFSGVDTETNVDDSLALVSGTGSTNNSQFQIDGKTLKTNAVLTYNGVPRSIRVRYWDDGNKTVDKIFYINVTDVNSAPTDISLSTYDIDEGNNIGLFSVITVTDADDSSHNITLAGGSNDNYFYVSNDSLYIDSVLNYDNIQQLNIRLQADDRKGGIYSENITITVNDTIAVQTQSVFVHINFAPTTPYEGDGIWNNFVGEDTYKPSLLDTLGNELDISLTLNGINSSSRTETSAVAWLPTQVRSSRFDNATLGASGYATFAGLDANQEVTIIYAGYANQTNRDGAIYLNDVFADSVNNQNMTDTIMWQTTADANGDLEIHFDPSSSFLYIDYLGLIVGEYSGGTQISTIEAPSALTLSIDTPHIKLNWVDNSSIESGFRIYHRLDTATLFTQLGSVSSNITTYTDSSVTQNIKHHYYVVSYNDSLVSTPSSTVNGIISTVPPAAPTGFTGVSTQNYVNLNWNTPVSANAVEVYRATGGGNFVNIANLGGTAISYKDPNVSIGDTYDYRIRFRNTYGASFYSNVISILVKEQANVPYIIPTMPTYQDWGITQTLYIDGDVADGSGSGTIGDPYGHFADQGGDSTRYLIKRGTTISGGAMAISDYVTFEAYGDENDPFPIIDGGFNFRYSGNHHFIGKNIHVYNSGGNANIRVYENPAGYFYFDNCKILGDPADPPSFNVYGMIAPAMFYHCEFGWAVQDNILASSWDNSYIVSCWFHHANRGNTNNGLDPSTTGDNIQFLLHNIQNFYGANNFLDRSDSWWKYNWILSVDGNPSGITIEYNSFKSPRDGKGGAIMLTGMGNNARLYGNIFYSWEPGTDVALAQTGTQLTDQAPPYGFRENILIGQTGDGYQEYNFWSVPKGSDYENEIIGMQAGGQIFNTWTAYRNWHAVDQGYYGSDLDINQDGTLTSTEFWDLWVDPRDGGVAPTLNAPTNLNLSISGSDIVVNWTDNSSNEEWFKIIHKQGAGGSYTLLDSVAPNVTTYTHTSVTTDVDLYYRVFATNSTLVSDTTSAKIVTISTAPPSTPQNLTGVSTPSYVQLSWDAVTLANSYQIIKSSNGTNFTQVKSVTSAETAWQDNAVVSGNTYHYAVRSTNNNGSSSYSDTIQLYVDFAGIRPYTIPTAPTAGDWGITDTVYIASDGSGDYLQYENQIGGKALYYFKRGGTYNTTYMNGLGEIPDSTIFDAYGSGAMPIISGQVLFRDIQNDYFVAKNIHFYAQQSDGNEGNIRMQGNTGYNQYFYYMNCRILGNPASPPNRNISGMGHNSTIYRCEIGYAAEDNVHGDAWRQGKFVSNWLHHANMGVTGTGDVQDDGDGFHAATFDGTQFYMANNWIDRSHSIWKYCLIINGGFSTGAKNVVVSYNTFISPKTGGGAAIVKPNLGSESRLTKNILWSWESSTNVSFFHTGELESLQAEPNGNRDNALIGNALVNVYGILATEILAQQVEGRKFTSWADWKNFWTNSGEPSYGSDLDLNNDGVLTTIEFWGTNTP